MGKKYLMLHKDGGKAVYVDNVKRNWHTHRLDTRPDVTIEGRELDCIDDFSATELIEMRTILNNFIDRKINNVFPSATCVFKDTDVPSMYPHVFVGLHDVVLSPTNVKAMVETRISEKKSLIGPGERDLRLLWVNEKKKIVTAKNRSGELIKVKCDEKDEFDPYVGAALAYAYQQFGSKTKFRKAVDKLLKKEGK